MSHSSGDPSFIVHSFNRVGNVRRLARGIREAGRGQLLVCDDGSIDGSREAWLGELGAVAGALVLSNDLHEIRILDRAIRASDAEIVCLLQDDDRIPPDRRWLDAALGAFERFRDLAVIGGFMAFNSCDRSPIRSRDSAIWGGSGFQFVWHVNIGPYFVRHRHYVALGGFDFGYSAPGEPGIGFDSEFCLRAWREGYQVGYRFTPLKGPPQSYSLNGGTMLFARNERFRNQWRNHELLYRQYAPAEPEIARRVAEANRMLQAGGACA